MPRNPTFRQEDETVARTRSMQRPSIVEEDDPILVADFETAISATAFGRFNVYLFLVSFPASWAVMFEILTMSFVSPAAECALNLTLTNKGTLNGIVFVGMVSSGILWGYLADSLGRRKILIYGFFLDWIVVVMSSFSQNVQGLIASKFFGGLIITGCFSTLAAYLGEFHCSKYRTWVQLVRGIAIGSGPMVLPLLAWVFMRLDLRIAIFNETFVFYAWNIFLLASSFPSLLSGIIFIFMPESPKFLMTVGKNAEALDVFRMVYKMNTRKPPETYKVMQLMGDRIFNDSLLAVKKTRKQQLVEGFKEAKPICSLPHVKNLIVVCLIQALLMMGMNAFMMWLPQLYQYISNHKIHHNGTQVSLCEVIRDVNFNTHEFEPVECRFVYESTVYSIPRYISSQDFAPEVYYNNFIIASLRLFIYSLVGVVVARLLGKRWILVATGLVSVLSSFLFYFATSDMKILLLTASYLAHVNLCATVVLIMTVDLFPTRLRTIAVSTLLVMGRIGSVIGNYIFPKLLEIGRCEASFAFLGAVVLVAMVLAILLPDTERIALV